MKKMKRINYKVPPYVIHLLVVSIITAALTILMQVILPAYSTPAMPFIVLFFFFVTLFSLYVVLRDQSQRDSRKFVSGYMLSRIIKFMSCLLFLLIYFIASKEDRWRFAGAFMVIYLIFAISEIFILKRENSRLQKLRDAEKQNPTETGNDEHAGQK